MGLGIFDSFRIEIQITEIEKSQGMLVIAVRPWNHNSNPADLR